MKPRLVVFPNGSRTSWYWHLFAGNNKLIADGGEGYGSRGNAKRAATRAIDLMAKAVLVVEK